MSVFLNIYIHIAVLYRYSDEYIFFDVFFYIRHIPVLCSTTRWSLGKFFQRGDELDSAAQTLAAANAAAAAAATAADTIAAAAAVAVIAAAEVTQTVADTTAELKVATAAKTQVAARTSVL